MREEELTADVQPDDRVTAFFIVSAWLVGALPFREEAVASIALLLSLALGKMGVAVCGSRIFFGKNRGRIITKTKFMYARKTLLL